MNHNIDLPAHSSLKGILLFLLCLTSFPVYANTQITKQEILLAQKTWADGVINIGKVYTTHGDYKKAAATLVDRLYAYQSGPVLFAPTKAAKQQFRLTRSSAISYFVGGNKAFSEDKGFALKLWTHIRFKNAGFFIHGDYAVAMGNYFFTPIKGKSVKVEYTFGYIKGKDGQLRINLHHSSLPYER